LKSGEVGLVSDFLVNSAMIDVYDEGVFGVLSEVEYNKKRVAFTLTLHS
jgi:hypothetical protein